MSGRRYTQTPQTDDDDQHSVVGSIFESTSVVSIVSESAPAFRGERMTMHVEGMRKDAIGASGGKCCRLAATCLTFATSFALVSIGAVTVYQSSVAVCAAHT